MSILQIQLATLVILQRWQLFRLKFPDTIIQLLYSNFELAKIQTPEPPAMKLGQCHFVMRVSTHAEFDEDPPSRSVPTVGCLLILLRLFIIRVF